LAGGWRGSLAYILLLLLIPLARAQGWLEANPYDIGVMDPERIRAGEWWRALTALMLHWDATHLLGNLGAGALLGISAAQVWGSARAWPGRWSGGRVPVSCWAAARWPWFPVSGRCSRPGSPSWCSTS